MAQLRIAEHASDRAPPTVTSCLQSSRMSCRPNSGTHRLPTHCDLSSSSNSWLRSLPGSDHYTVPLGHDPSAKSESQHVNVSTLRRRLALLHNQTDLGPWGPAPPEGEASVVQVCLGPTTVQVDLHKAAATSMATSPKLTAPKTSSFPS